MNRWLVGARPRTLPAAVVPVALGAAVGRALSGRDLLTAVALGYEVACRAGLVILLVLGVSVQPASGMALIAALPVPGSIVSVGPPLDARDPSIGSPEAKLVQEASPNWRFATLPPPRRDR